MIWIVFLMGGIYFFVIVSFFYGWEKLKLFVIKEEKKLPIVSVIIPMRNEEDNIGNLLNDLSMQTYPTNFFEVIVVDDHSTDQSIKKAKEGDQHNFTILKLSAGFSGKKDALNYGIKKSKGELIITTDADCRTGINWIKSIASFYQKNNPVMIMAPVIAFIQHTKSKSGIVSPLKKILPKLMELEMYSLLGSTSGSAAIGHPVMCNGANLAFPKSVYPEIENIFENKSIKSGDDIFSMLELKKKHYGKVYFLKSKEATVYTHLPTNIIAFFRQRSRWASKSRFYEDPFIIFTALTVFGINLLLSVLLVHGLLTNNLLYFLILFLIKSSIDLPFLLSVTSFFSERKLMVWFPIAESLYFLYVCVTVFVAFILPIGWKGRKV